MGILDFISIEIKSGQTISGEFFKNLDYFAKLTGKVSQSLLVYGGDAAQNRSGHRVVPWHRFRLP